MCVIEGNFYLVLKLESSDHEGPDSHSLLYGIQIHVKFLQVFIRFRILKGSYIVFWTLKTCNE